LKSGDLPESFAAFERSRKGVQAARFSKPVFDPTDRLLLSSKQTRGGALAENHPQLHRISTLRSAIVFVIGFALFLAGCSRSQPPARDTSNLTQITDEAGRTITVPQPVTRFVSLAPNLTEIVFALGAGDGLVGRTTYCTFPAEAQRVETVGDTLKPSIERIIALKPQVVFVSTASQLEAFTTELEAHQIAVYVTDSHDLDGVFSSMRRIGEVLGKRAEADALLEQLERRVKAVEQQVAVRAPVRVFYQMSDEPLYTIGRDAFITDLLKRAGGISVTADVPGAWPKFSAESALAARPEAIILPTGGSMGNANSNIAAALKQSPAALHGRVYKINDDLLSRPGPRSVDGLEELARSLHPEVFGK
jgi:iron complex transport system substrate-binding protein